METTEKNMEHGEHFNESIVNEVILEDMKKNRIDHMKYLPGMEVLEESDVMDQVISAMNAYDYDKYTEADVRRALAHDNRTPEDFQALLSPAALPLLEEIAQAAQKDEIFVAAIPTRLSRTRSHSLVDTVMLANGINRR